jgi:hypothetical protein
MSTKVSDVCADVRNKTNQANSQAVLDAVMVTWVNQAHHALHDLVIDRAVYTVTLQQFQVTPASVVTIDGKVGFALPADFYRMNKLSRVVSGGTSIQVPAINPSQLDQLLNGIFPAVSGQPGIVVPFVGYYLEPPNLLLVPGNNASAQFTLRYFQALPDLVSLADPINPLFDKNGWWEFLSYYVCVMLKDRLDQDASAYVGKLMQLTTRIMHAASNRDTTFGMRLDANRGRQGGRRTGGWRGGFGF